MTINAHILFQQIDSWLQQKYFYKKTQVHIYMVTNAHSF